jgi:hypothetical protein
VIHIDTYKIGVKQFQEEEPASAKVMTLELAWYVWESVKRKVCLEQGKKKEQHDMNSESRCWPEGGDLAETEQIWGFTLGETKQLKGFEKQCDSICISQRSLRVHGAELATEQRVWVSESTQETIVAWARVAGQMLTVISVGCVLKVETTGLAHREDMVHQKERGPGGLHSFWPEKFEKWTHHLWIQGRRF